MNAVIQLQGGDVMNLTKEQVELLLPKNKMSKKEFLNTLRPYNTGKKFKEVMFFNAVQAENDRVFVESLMQKGGEKS